MAWRAMGPTCRVASWLATLLLLLMATSSSCANDPSYTDCQPHIDATIRDLASKALKDGKLPLRPEPDETAAPTSGGSSDDAPTIEELPSETAPAQDLDKPAPEESKLPDPAEAVPIIEEEVHLDAVPTTVSIDTESISTRAEESLPPPTEAAPPAAAPDTAPVRVQSTNVGHTDGSAESQNLINKLVTSIFGKFPTERDAKWATPWQSHPEHIRAPVAQEKVEVSKEPGVVSKSINKMVVAIFGEHSAERDPKWADPWQTHPEHERKIPATTEQPREVIQDPRGGVLHRLICLVFDEPPKERDPKFAEPWQTHTDQQEKFKSSSEESVEAKPVVVASGGLLDKIVRTIFPAPDVERDPKYARPWQTHDEHIKVKVPASEVKEIAHESGGILDRLVRLVFPLDTENAVRDPKWAEPWQTHNPVKTQPVTAPEEKRVSTATTFPLFVFFDGLICKIFNVAPKERDPKWAIPWQDHDEHKKSIVEKRSEQIEQKVIGPTGGLLDKFVRTVFGLNETGERDPKYATPWQTHEEAGLKFQRADLVIDASPPAPKVVHEKNPVPEIKPEQKPSPEPVTHQTTTPPPKREERTLQDPLEVETLIQAGEESEEENKPLSQEGKGAEQDGMFRAEKVLDSVAEAAVAEKADHGSIDAPIVPTTPTKEEKSPHDDHDVEDDEEAEDLPQFVTAAGETVLQDSDDEEPDDDAEPDEENASSASVIPADETDLGTDDESDQIILVPAALRPRDHIEAILGLDEASRSTAMRSNPISDAALKELKNIYESSIKPLEVIYKYQDISNRHMSDAEIFGQPLVLVLGPYSTGKSSLLNYLMNVEYTRRALRTGANPSHGVFRIIQYGPEDAEVDGTALSASAHFGSLQKFGQNFVDQLRGSVRNVPLLKKVTFVEAPGILEMRRAGERQYPFNDVLQWFIDRADLVLVVFDYTKLDAGYELEAVLDQLKGREKQVRILLNKADQIPPEELIKVQGSLFWNLSPLLGVSAPPTVYAGSFSSRPYRTSSPAKLFQAQEEALLHDLARAINARVENRVANARRHAVRVRNHAQMVDSYLTTYNKNKGFLTSKHKLSEDIVENPHAYNIYEGVSLLTNISRYDLPDPEIYRDFFRLYNLYDFPTLKSSCSYLRGCPLDQIDRAISRDMPELLARYRTLLAKAGVSADLSPDADIFGDRPALSPVPHSKTL